MKSASITFRHGEPAKPFTPRTGESKLWRFVGDDFAAVLDPICHHQARAVKRCQVVEGKVAEEPPQFDHLEVWPVQCGIPDSIVTTNPAGVEKWLRKFYAHKPEAEKAEWEAWLEQIGKRLLWREFRTTELERDWLSSAGGAGRGLSLHARKPRIGFTNPLNVDLRDLERIRFRADFRRHKELTTIYLADCLEDQLTPDEIRTSPAFRAQEEAKLQAQRQLEARKAETEALRAANIAAETKLASQQQAHSKALKSPMQQQRDRQKRQAAGAATFQLVGHEEAAMQLIEYMREIRKKEVRADKKYGATNEAIAAGRDWWARKHTATDARDALNKVSASTLRRWIADTPLRLKSRRHKQ